jgi:hypothetical protein
MACGPCSFPFGVRVRVVGCGACVFLVSWLHRAHVFWSLWGLGVWGVWYGVVV